jgi:titin
VIFIVDSLSVDLPETRQKLSLHQTVARRPGHRDRVPVLLVSSAPAILAADGGSAEVDLFRVSFESVGVPARPNAPTGTPGDSRVTVSWTAPDDGGSPIVGYTVVATPGGRSCTWTSGPLTCDVTSLANGTAYTFTVRASNAQGSGPVSNASSAITPRTVPGAPRSPVATAGRGSVALSWTAPSSTGGAALTGYRVQRSTNGTTWTTVTNSAPLSRTFTVTGLTNGTRYQFRIAANNAAGAGANSSAVSATPRTVPGAPTKVVGKPAKKSVALTWKAPAATGGSPITAYRVEYSTNGKKWTTATTAAPLSRNFTVKKLKSGTTYRFRVAAINAAGAGAYSKVSTAKPK